MSVPAKVLKFSLLAGAGLALVACSSASSNARYGGGSDAYASYGAYESGGRYGQQSGRYGYEYGYGQQAMGGYCDPAMPALRTRYGSSIEVSQNCMSYPPVMMAPPQMQAYQQHQYASATPSYSTSTTTTMSTDCPAGSSWNMSTNGCVQNETTSYTTDYASNYTSSTSTISSTDCPAGSSWNSELSMCVQSESSYTSNYTSTSTYTPPPSISTISECPAGSYRSMDGTSCIEGSNNYPTPSIPVDWTPIRK